MTRSTVPSRTTGNRSLVLRLGTTQTLAWASSYYLPAILAKPMAHELGIPATMVFGALSVALVVSALLGKSAGGAIDRHGGRPVLAATNFLFATGLILLALAQGPALLFTAWIVMGVAMAGGLYDGAFAVLVRINPTQARSAITGITLLAGFASTVGWPITAALETAFGWREACLFWAAAHLCLGLPLNAFLPTSDQSPPQPRPVPVHAADGRRSGESMACILLATIFALTWFVTTAVAAHLPRLLQEQGMTLGSAVLTASLVGPAQVAGRIVEFGFLQRFNPILVTRIAALAHPLGAGALLVLGAPAATTFALLHGVGNGILTIAKGVLPLSIFGPDGYGARLGLIMAPARMAQAGAPLLFGLIVDALGIKALWVSAGLGLLAFLGLFTLSSIRLASSPASRPDTTS